MKTFSALLILLLVGCTAESSPQIVISGKYDVCTKATSAHFELHDGLDALGGRVSQGKKSASLYIGRHPQMYGENLPAATSSRPSLQRRLEINDKDKYIILYSYANEVSGFSYPVFDEIFISIEGAADPASQAFVHKIGSSLFRCHKP